MGDRRALTSFWENYADAPSLQTMMLNKDAETFDEQDRNDVMGSLPSLRGMRIVEIGSGIGRFTPHLAHHAKHVLATDFMKPFIDKNRDLHAHLGNIEFVCANAAKLDLEPENCDFVFTNWLLMYLTDVEVVDFLVTVLHWLTPNGWLHLRESCSESSKRTSDKPEENPTHYRHICQYLALIEKLRVKDEKTGRFMRFEVMWAKSIETYVQAVGNWRQVHALLRKVWTEPDENALPQGYADLVQELDVTSIVEKKRLADEMASRKALWKARSPFEALFLKFLKDQMNLTVDHGILNVCLDSAAAVSPFAIAEEFGCAVVNLDTNVFMYDYNLALANAAADKRIRFHWAPSADQKDWHLPKACFELVVACHLSSHVENFELALKNLKTVLLPGGKIILLEKSVGHNGLIEQAKNNGFSSTLALDDISSEVKQVLKHAINDIDKTPELQPLRQKYESWLKAGEGSTKWYLLTATHGD
jgi:phosphoethanolamine N-methyltransferase